MRCTCESICESIPVRGGVLVGFLLHIPARRGFDSLILGVARLGRRRADSARMALHPNIPIRPPASRFLLRFFYPTIGIRYDLIVQPMAALIAGRRIDDARNVAACGKDKACIYPDQIL